MVVCVFLLAVLIGMANSPVITKGDFIGAMFVYAYMVLLLIALFEKDS